MAELTFRDFAGAIMRGDTAGAATVLETLLALSPDAARAAAEHFRSRMTGGDPAFMQKAMGLRTAVTAGSDAEIATLLEDCFGLDETTRIASVAALRERYPRAT